MIGYGRTDLAGESYFRAGRKVEGATETVNAVEGFSVRALTVTNEEASKLLDKPIGRYVSVECKNVHLLGRQKREALCRVLSKELCETGKRLANKKDAAELSVLAVGLGNAEMTADAIGPKTVSSLNVTRHLRTLEPSLYRSLSCASLSAFAPGVLGQTGIETLELLRGAIRTVKPDVLLVIDALAAGEVGRLGSTVQISDTGIVPGSGVGNHRNALTIETLGVPVIAMGVPTVVDSATLVRDALRQANINEICEALQRVLDNGRGFFVSSKDSDTVTETFSEIFSRAIELAFVGDLSN